MGKITTLRSLAAALLLGLSPNLFADGSDVGVKLFADNFEYSVGRLTENSNATWKDFCHFSGPSNPKDSVKIIDGSLIYPDYQTIVSGNSIQLLTEGRDAAAIFPATSQPIYVSMLVNIKAAPEAGDFFFSLADRNNSTSDGFGKVHIKNVDGKLAFGVSRKALSSDATWTETLYEFNQTYLLVLKYVQVGGNDNDIAAIFVNPEIAGTEPTNPIIGLKGSDPSSKIAGMTLYQGRKLGNELQIDAIRVATSWEALFDQSAVAKVPEIFSSSSLYLGSMTKGDEPVKKILNVKGKNLSEDITVHYTSNGYFTIPGKTINKEAAESKDGFDLVITLNPKDNNKSSDIMTLTNGTASSSVSLSWYFVIPPPEINAEDIVQVTQASEVSFYTLLNTVSVTKIDTIPGRRPGMETFKYTIEDNSGSLIMEDPMQALTGRLDLGFRLTNLHIKVEGEMEKPTFTPIFSYSDSPELFIDKPATGVKLFKEEFDYPIGKLADNATEIWKDYSCFFGSTSKDSVMVVENSLTLEGYQPTAIGNSVRLITKGKDATAAFPATNGAIYTSMLVNIETAPADGDFFFALADKNNSSSEGFGKIHIKSTDGKLAFGITRKGLSDIATWTAADYEFNKTYLLVLKYVQIPGNDNDVVALFVNPNTEGSEPESPLTGAGGSDPSSTIAGLNLYQGRELGNNLLVDAIRVATSWETLFDHSTVTKVPEILVSSNLYVGTFTKGEEPLTQTLKIKAKNLKSDITVQYTSDGYFNIPSNTISKTAAEGENGFDLIITLNPKDGNRNTDIMTFTSGKSSSATTLTWAYIIPTPELEAENIAAVKGATEISYYTLVNAVKVIKADTLGRGMINYTIEDSSGTLEVTDHMMTLTEVALESLLSKLRIKVDSEPESHSFKPIYSIDDSPELVVTPPVGIGNISNNSIIGYVNGEFIVEGAGIITVYDTNGKQLVESRNGKIGIRSLCGSIFIIRYTDKAGIDHAVKIIK